MQIVNKTTDNDTRTPPAVPDRCTAAPKLTWGNRTKNVFMCSFKSTSISFKILAVWLLFEILLCLYALLSANRKNYVENFICYICDKNRCPNFLEHALYGRIILSTIAIIGIFGETSSLTSLWFLMNALGIFPLIPVVYSCFGKYEELEHDIRKAKGVYNIIGRLWSIFLPPEIRPSD